MYTNVGARESIPINKVFRFQGKFRKLGNAHILYIKLGIVIQYSYNRHFGVHLPQWISAFPHAMCSEAFPVCIPEDMVCNQIADCAESADELPALCGNGNTKMHV